MIFSDFRKVVDANVEYPANARAIIDAADKYYIPRYSQKPTNEPELWEQIKEEASVLADSPAYDYGLPNWVFMQFISELKNKYSISLK